MHAVFLTLLVVTSGADKPIEAPADQAATAAANQPVAATVEDDGGDCYDDCGTACRGGRRHPLVSWFCDVLGPMPQTCYGSRFGCYPGSSRTIHRYPAFHGYYYRHPYNYRHLFDYPWHASPHEPMGFFAYQQQVVEEDACNSPFQEEPTEAEQLQLAPPKSANSGQARRLSPPPLRTLQR